MSPGSSYTLADVMHNGSENMMDDDDFEADVHSVDEPEPGDEDLLEAIVAERPDLADALAGDVAIQSLNQPFFTLHQIFWLDAGPLQLHVAEGEEGDVTILTGDQDAFNALTVLDPPGLLLDEATAHAYAVYADTWIADWPSGERYLPSFDAIELRSPLSSREKQTVEAIRKRLAGEITAPRTVKLSDDEFALDRWVVADRKLLRRRLTVASNGRVDCQREVKAGALPIR